MVMERSPFSLVGKVLGWKDTGWGCFNELSVHSSLIMESVG